METLYSIENAVNDRKKEVEAEIASRRLLKEIEAEDNNPNEFIRIAVIVLIVMLISLVFASIAYAGYSIW